MITMPNQTAIGRWFAVAGSFCIFAPVISFLLIAVTFSRRLNAPIADDASIRHEIGMDLRITGICILLSLLGYCLAGVAILAFRFRPSWLRSNLLIGSFLLLPAFPFGTVFALTFFIVLIWTQRAFITTENV